MAVTNKYDVYYVKGPYFCGLVELRSFWSNKFYALSDSKPLEYPSIYY